MFLKTFTAIYFLLKVYSLISMQFFFALWGGARVRRVSLSLCHWTVTGIAGFANEIDCNIVSMFTHCKLVVSIVILIILYDNGCLFMSCHSLYNTALKNALFYIMILMVQYNAAVSYSCVSEDLVC